MSKQSEVIPTRMHDLSTSGYWWLPNNEANRLGGTLTFTKDEGARLELLGSFADLETFFGDDTHYDAIYGATTDNKEVTLVDCDQSQANLGARVPTQVITARFVITGGYVKDFSAMKFQRILVRFSNLEDWLGQAGIEQSAPPSAAGPYTLTYTRPNLPSIRIPAGTLRFRFGWRSHHTRFRRAAITEHAVMEVHQGGGFTFAEGLRKFVWPFQSFLTLCTLEPSDVVEIHIGRRQGQKLDGLLRIYYQTNVESPPRAKPLLPSQMLIDASSLGRNMTGAIRKWLIASADLRSVLSLYFAVMSGRWMFLESRFLNLVQAAEVFHRHTYPNFILTKAAHQKRVKEIVEHVPEKHSKWLDDVLKFSNEPRLAERLKDLVEASSAALRWTEEEKVSLVNRTRDTRHYLTHYDPKGAKKALRSGALYWHSDMLLFMVGTLVLQHVNVPASRIRAGLENNQRFQWARTQWRELVLQ